MELPNYHGKLHFWMGFGGPGVKVAELWRNQELAIYTNTLPKAIFDLPGVDV